MKPTQKLRFVERTKPVIDLSKNVAEQKIRVLQQWWAPFRTFSDGYGYQTEEQIGGQWRDVPLEQEQP
jgi:hypothetical protein